MMTAAEQARAEYAGLDTLAAAAHRRYIDALDREEDAHRAHKAACEATNKAWHEYNALTRKRDAAMDRIIDSQVAAPVSA